MSEISLVETSRLDVPVLAANMTYELADHNAEKSGNKIGKTKVIQGVAEFKRQLQKASLACSHPRMPRAQQAGFSRRFLAGVGFFETVRSHGSGLALLTNRNVQQQQHYKAVQTQCFSKVQN
ncbi:hypothetical protein TNCV_2292831 [Trichonephila clavipes]|nr:hypothetical protein TNCV_2292831 [Trichonephila clavipes]